MPLNLSLFYWFQTAYRQYRCPWNMSIIPDGTCVRDCAITTAGPAALRECREAYKYGFELSSHLGQSVP
jgi:hypothetical protein